MNVNYLLPRRLLGYQVVESNGYALLFLGREQRDVVGVTVGRDRYDSITVPLKSFEVLISPETGNLAELVEEYLSFNLNKQIFLGIGSTHGLPVGICLCICEVNGCCHWLPFPEEEEVFFNADE